MTHKIYELLDEFSSAQFQYAGWGGVDGTSQQRDAAKAALIAEIDRLVEVEKLSRWHLDKDGTMTFRGDATFDKSAVISFTFIQEEVQE